MRMRYILNTRNNVWSNTIWYWSHRIYFNKRLNSIHINNKISIRKEARRALSTPLVQSVHRRRNDMFLIWLVLSCGDLRPSCWVQPGRGADLSNLLGAMRDNVSLHCCACGVQTHKQWTDRWFTVQHLSFINRFS